MLNVKRIFSLSVLAVCIASISACYVSYVKDENSVFYAVAVGSSLILNQAITIPGGQVAIYLQAGEILPYGNVDKYRPNCKFEIYTISEKPRSVQTDSFQIIKVEDDIESSSMQNNTQLASVDNVVARNNHAFGMLDHSEVFNYATLMYLRSDKQKDVYRLTCQHWESILDDKHLSIKQMRDAMGAVLTLNIKE